LNRVIQLQAAFIQQHANAGRGQRDRRRADSKAVLRRRRHAVLQIREPEALRPHDFAIDTYRHGHSRQVLLRQGRPNETASPLDGRGPFCGGGKFVTDEILSGSAFTLVAVRRTYTSRLGTATTSTPTPSRKNEIHLGIRVLDIRTPA